MAVGGGGWQKYTERLKSNFQPRMYAEGNDNAAVPAQIDFESWNEQIKSG